MRRWPWFLAAAVLATGAVVAMPGDTEVARTESASSPPTATAAPPIATVVFAIAAGVCVIAGFRPRSAAVRRALGLDPKDDDPPARPPGP